MKFIVVLGVGRLLQFLLQFDVCVHHRGIIIWFGLVVKGSCCFGWSVGRVEIDYLVIIEADIMSILCTWAQLANTLLIVLPKHHHISSFNCSRWDGMCWLHVPLFVLSWHHHFVVEVGPETSLHYILLQTEVAIIDDGRPKPIHLLVDYPVAILVQHYLVIHTTKIHHFIPLNYAIIAGIGCPWVSRLMGRGIEHGHFVLDCIEFDISHRFVFSGPLIGFGRLRK